MYGPNENKWRIGLASNAFKYLRDLDIPAPLILYRSFSQRVPQSKGAQGLQGYKNFVLSWRDLSIASLYVLETYVTAARAASPDLLYLTIDRADGTAPGRDWIDVSGRVYWPEFEPGPRNRSGVSVGLVVNNVTIINTPASF